ncbi:glycoside hydrolase family 65 protein [Marinifilum caeruleilacunae]|uniref:Glycoside hydrolase family 65 protein n=1 Tax=Marinifilum caeruleilacunae TaxID=2499076 RepID=A0ABX1WWT4_9BACT|nr:glycoside hydrolase family 65 protein [Marinifilum caeruleilacunae]NOU60353.1 glycoside hydrolase family 65 protein [Marinifilum caeruleilacunae]
MNEYLKHDEWCIIEEGFNPENHRASESIFSLGNGNMGQRAMFEEHYSGETLQGTYVAGVYYPDKTRVGWWKNGYPEYFAKVLNAPNWIGIDVKINGEMLDLAKCEVSDFVRTLNMKEGVLERSFVATLSNGNKVKVEAKRFLSIVTSEVGAIRYSVTPLNFDGKIAFTPYVDADVSNEDSNYDEQFWNVLQAKSMKGEAYITAATKKLDFHVSMSMKYDVYKDGQKLELSPVITENAKYVANTVEFEAEQDVEYSIYKYAAVLSSLNHSKTDISSDAVSVVEAAQAKGYGALLEEHVTAWADKWDHSDIMIEGDVAAQQAIRFNIFQMNQTYTGEDERLNIGPKGFTGEKYGGSTYWDTEAYCVPFYLSTSKPEVTRNLLIYRHKQLQKAIENAAKLGFTNGAALYPMVTMNGEECHNEWEITFEEIHRNGAIAFAIYNYIRHTGDKKYLEEYGLDVLIGISRFWSQRVSYSQAKKKYVMLGVTGPNEYENNINNNWYTNTIATWCMKYAQEAMAHVKETNPARFDEIMKNLNFDFDAETAKWTDIIENMYYPVDEETGVYMQQDGFMDKEQILASELDPAIRPINQHWSWDRILRSCFIKQADVLQGIYLFEDQYDLETIRKNYDFYEPRTVHESSLSPCIHSILAATIGDEERAYNLYLRTSRLDLDDYNKEVHEGLHITSMAGTWMSIVEGFGGMRVVDGKLVFKPMLPKEWKSYSFKVRFRGNLLNVRVSEDGVGVINEEGETINIFIKDDEYKVEKESSLVVEHA